MAVCRGKVRHVDSLTAAVGCVACGQMYRCSFQAQAAAE
jgi:hypothetical protein